MERKISAMRNLRKASLLAMTAAFLLAACSTARRGKVGDEKIPEIYGTWYQDGKKEAPCFIVQNGRDLVFMSGKETSNGYFRNSVEVMATDWNRNAILSNDLQHLRFADRTWTRGSFTYPDLSGHWYADGDSSRSVSITQVKDKLVIQQGTEKLNAYFYTTNGLYLLEKNSYGVFAPAQNTLTWGNKTWHRQPKP